MVLLWVFRTILDVKQVSIIVITAIGKHNVGFDAAVNKLLNIVHVICVEIVYHLHLAHCCLFWYYIEGKPINEQLN